MASELPTSLRPIAHLIKIGNEYATRDVVIYYWALYRAVQHGMKLDKSSPDALNFLMSSLSTLEQIKKDNPTVEALTQDIVAQAHVEDQAQRLFNYAEMQDKAGVFNMKVVKAFYTSGYLFEILSVFGEPDENIQSAQKYSKWRATYIHNCLKAGETPVPGNQTNQIANDYGLANSGVANVTQGINQFSIDQSNNFLSQPTGTDLNSYFPNPPADIPLVPGMYEENKDLSNQAGKPVAPSRHDIPSFNNNYNQFPPSSRFLSTNDGYQQPFPQQHPAGYPSESSQIYTDPYKPSFVKQSEQFVPPSNVLPSSNLKLEDFIEARKFTKYALSALDYDDAKTAIDNMHKALAILQKQ